MHVYPIDLTIVFFIATVIGLISIGATLTVLRYVYIVDRAGIRGRQ